MKYYAGIGARKTPQDILELMTRTARKLDGLGFILRSGGAIGSDLAFEKGATKKEIFYARDCIPQALEIVKKLHPAWERCTSYAKNLHGRNAMQILGADLQTPVDFVLCWTQDGCLHHNTRTIRTGGTGTAISIASLRGIEIFNLARSEHLARIKKFIK